MLICNSLIPVICINENVYYRSECDGNLKSNYVNKSNFTKFVGKDKDNNSYNLN